MIDTYIINLKEEIQNYYTVKNKLIEKNFENIYRFDAIYGKKIKDINQYDKYLTKFLKYFGPLGTIGSALSHYILLENIYNNTLKKNDPSLLDKYVLILEDDVVPNYHYNYLKNIVKNIPSDSDILILHSFEQFLFYKNKFKQDYILKNKLFLASPCCSYLIKVSSIPKIINKKLWSYYDAQHFNYNFFNNDTNIYLYKKQIFNTNYNISHNLKFNFIYDFFDKIFIYFNIPNIFFWTLFKIFRIPILNYELNSIEFNIICIIIIIFLYKWKKSSFKSIV